jgi:hypothetical protein
MASNTNVTVVRHQIINDTDLVVFYYNDMVQSFFLRYLKILLTTHTPIYTYVKYTALHTVLEKMSNAQAEMDITCKP